MEYQASRIEMILGAYKVPARVWQAKVTPRFVRFDITTALGARLNKVNGLAEEIALGLGVRSARVYREAGMLHVEIPRDHSRTVELLEMAQEMTAPVPPLAAVLGIEQSGAPLLLRLDSADIAHILLAGTTGSGKTVLLRTLLLSLAMHNRAGQLQIALIDPKGRGYGALAALPHIWQARPVAQTTTAAAQLLQDLVREMERRDRLDRHLPHLVIAIDELPDLLVTGGKLISEPLLRLTQRGREAGLHVIAATQRPSATLVGGMVKANFPVRLVGLVVSAEDAKVASGIAGSGAERLLGGGDFLLVAKGQVIRFQAAYCNTRQLGQTVARIRLGGGRNRRWLTGVARGGEELTVPAPLPSRETRPETDPGEVGEDHMRADTARGAVAQTGERMPASPGTVPPPYEARSPQQSDVERLAQLLPPGHYLTMRRPVDEREREILRLAFTLTGGVKPMCRRVYGTSPSGAVRVKSDVRHWLRELGVNLPGDPPSPAAAGQPPEFFRLTEDDYVEPSPDDAAAPVDHDAAAANE